MRRSASPAKSETGRHRFIDSSGDLGTALAGEEFDTVRGTCREAHQGTSRDMFHYRGGWTGAPAAGVDSPGEESRTPRAYGRGEIRRGRVPFRHGPFRPNL